MANPSYAQPFAPVGSAVQYEAPHGLLKLRGGHDQHDTSAFPELDKQGVSHDTDSNQANSLVDDNADSL